MRKFVMQAIAAMVILLGVAATPAMAQATRTWVSGVGDDANPCSRTAPCKTLAGAISKTASGGEINILDPAGVGAVTITKPITIRGEGVTASILVAGTNGINVNLPNPTDRVVLQDIEIEGLNQISLPGLTGINMISPGILVLEDVSIRGFTTGIVINTAGTAELTINNSRIIGSTTYALSISNVAGRSRAWITDSLIANSGLNHIYINGSTNLLTLGTTTFTGRGSTFLLENGGRVNSYVNNMFNDPPASGLTVIPLH